MQAAYLVAETVTPVILLALIGFLWVRNGQPYPVSFVTSLAMKLAIPSLVFTTLIRTELATDALIGTAAAAVAAHLALMAIFATGLWFLGMDMRTYLSPLTFGNTGNIGLPVALFAFGQAGLDQAIVVFSVSALLVFSVGIWMVTGGRPSSRMLREPATLAVLAAILFLVFDLSLPRAATNTLNLLGQLAIPLMLLTLGVAISRLSLRGAGRLLPLSLAKIGICAVVALGIGQGFGLTGIALAVLVMQMATPVAITSYVIAGDNGADGEAVAGLVLASTLATIITMPIILAFFL